MQLTTGWIRAPSDSVNSKTANLTVKRSLHHVAYMSGRLEMKRARLAVDYAKMTTD